MTQVIRGSAPLHRNTHEPAVASAFAAARAYKEPNAAVNAALAVGSNKNHGETVMRRTVRALAHSGFLSIVWLVSCNPAQAGESVPINAKFGIEWTQVNWSNPLNRISETRGAAGLPNGNSIGIATRGRSSAATGLASSEYVHLRYSATDWVYAQYVDMPVTFDPVTNTASFDGPLTVIGGEGRFSGASGTLKIHLEILFGDLLVGTVAINGVIRTAD